ncbi:hypothetical protein FRC07_004977, partial [Ceratobasidium sp. 392]
MSRYLDLRMLNESERALYTDDDHTAVEIAVAVARDMALHGYLSRSAEIIAPIWEFSRSGNRSFSHGFLRNTISLSGLEVLWKYSNFKPRNLPGWISLLSELGYTSEHLELEQRDHFCQTIPAAGAALSETTSNPKWNLMVKSLKVNVDPKTGARRLPHRDTERECLRTLCHYIDEISPPSAAERVGSRPLGLAIDLAIKYNDHENTLKIFEKFAARIANLVPDAARELALAARTGKIIRDMTALRDATGLTEQLARGIAGTISLNVRRRLNYGEPRPHMKLSWGQLLSEIDKREARTYENEYDAELPFLRPPATPDQIEQAEIDLSITLPQDYKDFLAVSDGLGSYNLAQTTPLIPVDLIFWDEEHCNLRVEYRRFETKNDKAASLPSLNRALQISEVDDDAAANWWLIEPSLIRSAKGHMDESGAVDWLGVNYAEWNP